MPAHRPQDSPGFQWSFVDRSTGMLVSCNAVERELCALFKRVPRPDGKTIAYWLEEMPLIFADGVELEDAEAAARECRTRCETCAMHSLIFHYLDTHYTIAFRLIVDGVVIDQGLYTGDDYNDEGGYDGEQDEL